ncbi:MAG TPA: MBL fold metallo-hydrolase [Acidobacteriaceae bacterium]|nr:MBL fold metallo-hydrolase [Acidobacteriaceae bacterium]
MVKMTVLASGSRGNSTVVSSSRTRILVDAGVSCRELFKRMAAAGEDPRTLDAILITHEHQDHVQGLAVTARKLGVPVYFTEPTHREWMRWITPRKKMTYTDWLAARKAEVQAVSANQGIEGREAFEEERAEMPEATEPVTDSKPAKDPCALPAVEYFCAGEAFSIGDIAVTPFTLPHDAVDPVGFVFEADGVRIGLATDLGYLPSNAKQHLNKCDVLMLESNHDLDMLRDGPYPWSVKQRVMSRVGHLSNLAAAEFLESEYDGGAAFVVLAHLSESNNLPELARVSAERALADRMNLLKNRILLATQDRPLESIVL